MKLTFTPVDEADARQIMAWRYDEPYAVYNMGADFANSADGLGGLWDRRRLDYGGGDEEGELIGFFGFGTAAQVWDHDEPALYSEDQTIDIGLGLRPDLTGQGLGLAFVNAGLAF